MGGHALRRPRRRPQGRGVHHALRRGVGALRRVRALLHGHGRVGRGGAGGDRRPAGRRVTDQLFLRDAYLREFTARVTGVRDDAVALDRTAFYPTGGGQPHDTGALGPARVVDVRKEGDEVWHVLDGVAVGAGDADGP